jgi:hypothetical protein
VFTDQPQEAAARLSAFGLSEGTPNMHPGQGTPCRRFYFQNAYLELVWVSSEVEIQTPRYPKNPVLGTIQVNANRLFTLWDLC